MTTDTNVQKRGAQAQATQPERVRSGPTYRPVVDIVEQDDELMLLADMPGVRTDDVDITYERGRLTIYGPVAPRETAERNAVLREHCVGDFDRAFEIGEGIDSSRIPAEMRDGVLTLHLPKTQEVLPRKIAIRTS